jgi:hypothetical protein
LALSGRFGHCERSRHACQLGARCLDVTFKVDDLANQFTITPQAEGVAIGVK